MGAESASQGDGDRELPVSEVRTQLPHLIDRAESEGEVTYITRDGNRVAAIVPLEMVEVAEQWEDQQWAKRAEQAMAEHRASGEAPIPAEDVHRELGLQ